MDDLGSDGGVDEGVPASRTPDGGQQNIPSELSQHQTACSCEDRFPDREVILVGGQLQELQRGQKAACGAAEFDCCTVLHPDVHNGNVWPEAQDLRQGFSCGTGRVNRPEPFAGQKYPEPLAYRRQAG